MNPLDDMRFLLWELETEMRRLHWWQTKSPSAEALASGEPFCVDYLTFSEWLQWVYTPKMLAYMDDNQALPQASNLAAIACEAWRGTKEDTAHLYDIISALDGLVIGNRSPLEKIIAAQIRH